MAAVIIPGLIICTLAVYLVGKQESARLLDVRRDFTLLLNRTRNEVEARVSRLVEAVSAQAVADSRQLILSEKILAHTRGILLDHAIVKFPFFVSSTRGFLFPVTQPAELPVYGTSSPVMSMESTSLKQLFQRASDLEYKQESLTEAVKAYMICLKSGASAAPYVYNAIGRCYFKLRRFPQALAYYNKVFLQEPRLRDRDQLLYFTVLRQKAVSFKQMGTFEEAGRVYLRLYEEILAQRGRAGSGPLAFYKNEALDFLNSRDNAAEESTDRFLRAKALDRLDDASELDISLRWLYFDTETGVSNYMGGANEGVRFLKLRELYESDNEKTRFYNRVKFLMQKPNNSEDLGGQTRFISFTDLLNAGTHRLCFTQLPPTDPELGTVFFGFMISLEHVRRAIVPAVVREQLNRDGVRVAIVGSAEAPAGKGLIAVPMGALFPGRYLALYADSPDFFREVVRKDIRLYYILLAALVLTLAAGIFVFYKYIAREAELVRLKSSFVDSASHTLKTPLTRMSLLAENVAQGWVNDEKQKLAFFQAIVDETARMSEMIENMLNFSRIEAGKQHYEPQSVRMDEIVARVIETYSEYARNLGFQLETDLGSDLPQVYLDPRALYLIVGNLLHNAVKYSAAEKFISLRLFCFENQVCLEVRDRGIGIEDKHLNLLFKKFSRVPDDHVNAVEGSGLGLYLVKHAVDAHNGRISVTSEPGRGTVFGICFPVKN